MLTEKYFAENGLTSTSAEHLCNVAKEFLTRYEKELSNVRFIDESCSLIGGQKVDVSFGNTDTDVIMQNLLQVAKIKSLEAWLRESIKAKAALKTAVETLTFYSWLKKNGLETDFPKRNCFQESDYYDTLSIKDRNKYFLIETYASTLGKFIHKGGQFSNAKNEYFNALSNPTKITGEGADTIFYYYSPSIGIDKVNDLEFNIQNKYRSYQAELNSIKSKAKTWVFEQNQKDSLRYEQEKAEYDKKRADYFNQYSTELEQESKRIADLKIIIPDDLKETYEFLNSLGKKSN